MSRLVLQGLAIAVGLALACQTADAVLISYWPFEEGFDQLGSLTFDAENENHGSLGRNVERVPGLVGVSAVRFDNTGASFINAGPGANDSFLVSSGLSLEALIVPTWTGEIGDYEDIFRKEDGGNRILFGFQNDTNGAVATPPVDAGPVLSFGLNVGGAYEEMDMPLGVDLTGLTGGTPNSGTIYLADPGVPLGPNDVVLQDGDFHHIAATYDDSTGEKSLYVNGVLRWTTIAENQLIMSGGTASATIGNVVPGGGEAFRGVIDEMAFYNHPLSAAEVATHYSNVRSGLNYFGVQPPTPPSQDPPLADPGNLAGLPASLIAFWDFDEASGPVEDFTLNYAYDRKGSADGDFLGTATREAGLVGAGAAAFDNLAGTGLLVGNGGQDNVFAATTGIAIEALVLLNWTGVEVDYDTVFRKEDGGNRILFSFQNDTFGEFAVIPVDPGPVLSLGLNVGGAYGELDMPLNVDLTTLAGGNAESGTVFLEDPGAPLGANDVILKDGEMHYVLAQYESESGEMAIYIDGTKRWSFAQPVGSLVASGGGGSAFIGSWGNGENFTGTIDELAIWSRALTQAEIDLHVANALAGMNYFIGGPGPVAGDYNGDGVVDAADYTAWRDTLGQSVALGTGADGDGDGVIGIEDYNFWKGQFGTSSGSGSGSEAGAVPEPGSVALALIAGLTLLGACTRRS